MIPTIYRNLILGAFAVSAANVGNAQSAAYEGKPYPASHVITRSGAVIEAEDFDEGGLGKSYNFKIAASRKEKGEANGYRKDTSDADARFTPVNGIDGGRIIGNIDGSDWACYTFEVKDAGLYTIAVTGSCDGNSKYTLTIDGKPIARDKAIPNKGWGSYNATEYTDVPLTAGKHVLRWAPVGGQNVDKFTFTYTAPYKDIPVEGLWSDTKYTYPLTDKYETMPLFVKFPSPTFGQAFEGNLYTADPSAHVWESDPNTLYVYASHDMEPNRGCDRMDRYHIFSTQDMVNWTDHGEFLNADQVNADVSRAVGFEVVGDGFMWAPDAAYNKRDGKYYFIFPHQQYTIVRDRHDYPHDNAEYWLHVLYTSDTPVGPWTYKGFVTGKDGQLLPKTIDPCLFVDDDGEAYIYISGDRKGCWAGRLDPDDWTKLVDENVVPQVDPEGTLLPTFHEAPFVIKKDGVYFLTYSDGNPMNLGGNKLLYATSDSPLGPWTPQGPYMNPHGEDTTHGSIVWFKGKPYQFYHTANYSGNGAVRSVCFTDVNVHDGKIDMIRFYGKPGKKGIFAVGGKKPVVIPAEAVNVNDNGKVVSHVGYFKRPANEEFVAFADQTRPLELLPKGGIANMGVKEWTRYTIDVKEDGMYDITLKALRKENGTRFSLGLDGIWFAHEVSLDTPLNEWADQTVKAELKKGVYCLEFRSMKGLMDLKSITIAKSK